MWHLICPPTAENSISFEKARSLILESVPPQPTMMVGWTDALGGVLARDVHSPENVPAFDNSAMDGFAVRSADIASIPTRLQIAAEVLAGHTPRTVVTPGVCAEIMTGAPIPDGADTVVPVEHTERVGEDFVQINQALPAGSHVRRAAKDIQEGELLFEAGTRVTPPILGLFAMLGIDELAVSKTPRVAVITTGDELVSASEQPRAGQIRDANSPTLAAQTRAAGALPGPLLRVEDDETALREAIEQALEADVLLVAGGMSVGRHDYVRPVFDTMGLELHFWRVRQRPGRPFGFGMLREKPVFGLPGNPTTASVCFEMHVRPALARMVGCRKVVAARYPAILDAPVRKPSNLHYFSRGVAAPGEDGRLHARAQGPQSSGFYAPMARANCIIHLPEGLEDPPAGTHVEVEWLAWAAASGKAWLR